MVNLSSDTAAARGELSSSPPRTHHLCLLRAASPLLLRCCSAVALLRLHISGAPLVCSLDCGANAPRIHLRCALRFDMHRDHGQRDRSRGRQRCQHQHAEKERRHCAGARKLRRPRRAAGIGERHVLQARQVHGRHGRCTARITARPAHSAQHGAAWLSIAQYRSVIAQRAPSTPRAARRSAQ